jgi:hypothetical protein
MNSNCISSIEPGTFERMFEISVLNMGHQWFNTYNVRRSGIHYGAIFWWKKMRTICENIFKNLTMLREIYLYGNSMTIFVEIKETLDRNELLSNRTWHF